MSCIGSSECAPTLREPLASSLYSIVPFLLDTPGLLDSESATLRSQVRLPSDGVNTFKALRLLNRAMRDASFHRLVSNYIQFNINQMDDRGAQMIKNFDSYSISLKDEPHPDVLGDQLAAISCVGRGEPVILDLSSCPNLHYLEVDHNVRLTSVTSDCEALCSEGVTDLRRLRFLTTLKINRGIAARELLLPRPGIIELTLDGVSVTDQATNLYQSLIYSNPLRALALRDINGLQIDLSQLNNLRELTVFRCQDTLFMSNDDVDDPYLLTPPSLSVLDLQQIRGDADKWQQLVRIHSISAINIAWCPCLNELTSGHEDAELEESLTESVKTTFPSLEILSWIGGSATAPLGLLKDILRSRALRKVSIESCDFRCDTEMDFSKHHALVQIQLSKLRFFPLVTPSPALAHLSIVKCVGPSIEALISKSSNLETLQLDRADGFALNLSRADALSSLSVRNCIVTAYQPPPRPIKNLFWNANFSNFKQSSRSKYRLEFNEPLYCDGMATSMFEFL